MCQIAKKKMLKLSPRLFLLCLVTGSVSSLKCFQMNPSKCNREGDRVEFFSCLKDHIEESVPCESPKVCLYSAIMDKADHAVVLKGCGFSGNCRDDLDKKLLGEKIANELHIRICSSCYQSDNCDANLSIKDLNGPKNSTDSDALSATPKSSEGSRSHLRMTTMQQTSIFVLIFVFSISLNCWQYSYYPCVIF